LMSSLYATLFALYHTTGCNSSSSGDTHESYHPPSSGWFWWNDVIENFAIWNKTKWSGMPHGRCIRPSQWASMDDFDNVSDQNNDNENDDHSLFHISGLNHWSSVPQLDLMDVLMQNNTIMHGAMMQSIWKNIHLQNHMQNELEVQLLAERRNWSNALNQQLTATNIQSQDLHQALSKRVREYWDGLQ